jgi:serine/threonine-protein kinase RsbW
MPEPAQEGTAEVLSIRSDPARFREVRVWLEGIALGLGLDAREAHETALAVNEVCANVHRHAYGGSKDGRIDLCAEADAAAGTLRLTIRDYGVAFDVHAVPPPSAEPQEGGYGVFLIRSLMDRAEFTNMGIGTRVVLVKNRRTAEVSR